jgi:hypothetical protein
LSILDIREDVDEAHGDLFSSRLSIRLKNDLFCVHCCNYSSILMIDLA